jgi:uncharacterized protein (TIGR00269 family)
MRCNKCGGRPVYFQRYSGQKFCETHFKDYFEYKFRRTIKKYRMLERDEKIAVALSGGKDSITALYLLNKIGERMGISLYAIAVDEGIKGYREKTLKNAEKFCKKYNIPLHILSFREYFGKTLDEMQRESMGCYNCGVLRRRLLNDKSRELGASKLATGHNLDDEVQTIMMNYIRGDLERLIRLHKSVDHEKFVKRIKPLSELPEKEVAVYATLQGFNAPLEECPYSANSFREDIKKIIYFLENENPGIKYSILRGYQKLQPYLENYSLREIMNCKICGNPSSSEMCKACQLEMYM